MTKQIHRHIKSLIASFEKPISLYFMQKETKYSPLELTEALDDLLKRGEIELSEGKYKIKENKK